MMAGQSVGLVMSEQPIADILEELMSQAESLLEQRETAGAA